MSHVCDETAGWGLRGDGAQERPGLCTIGGPGSGYFGHPGRPGQVGGSVSTGPTDRERYGDTRERSRRKREKKVGSTLPETLIDRKLRQVADDIRNEKEKTRRILDGETGEEITHFEDAQGDVIEVSNTTDDDFYPPSLKELREFLGDSEIQTFVVTTPDYNFVLTIPKEIGPEERRAIYETMKGILEAKTPGEDDEEVSRLPEAKPSTPAATLEDWKELDKQTPIRFRLLQK